LNDVLVLHDTIGAQGRDLYNEGGGKRGGRLKFVEKLEGGRTFKFPFIGEEREHRLSGGALLPMLGHFGQPLSSTRQLKLFHGGAVSRTLWHCGTLRQKN
jgi:hypothetical protein